MNPASKRAARRHHLSRLKQKVRDYYGGWSNNADRKERVLGILAHTRTVCSCWMCGNPRRYQHELSFPELRLHGRPRRWSNKPGELWGHEQHELGVMRYSPIRSLRVSAMRSKLLRP
jgi:hypothetical protein